MADQYTGPVPNLPGYSPSRRPGSGAAKTSGLRVVNGYAIDMQVPADTGLKREITNYAELAARAPKAQAAPEIKMPKWMAEDKQVLRFMGYFKEAVTESNGESFRVRQVVFYYYLEDDTLQISEPKVENSGIPQGSFIKRHAIKDADGNLVKPEDLLVGRNFTAYGRTFHIVDADDHTRTLLGKAGFNVRPAEPYPEDPYGTSRAAFMARETGADPTVYRGIVSNPTKAFVEAQLGNAAKNNRALGEFLEYDKKVLRFDAVWDDTRPHGKLRRFTLHFYLADGTLDICEKYEPNCGFDPIPKLMAKQKFLKRQTGSYLPPSSGTMQDLKPEDFVQADDLFIGKVLDVNGRAVEILDADQFTRDFYASKGTPLRPGISRERPAKPLARETEPPPHTFGIGTEEDSAASWHSLHPKPPRRDLEKMQKFDQKKLSFVAKLVSSRADDRDRVFTINYFLGDDTISVFEPPIRNTGIIGGAFLRKGKYRNREGNYFHWSELKVHNDVVLGGFTFHIADVDVATQTFLDTQGVRGFSSVNIKSIITKLVLKLRRKSHTIQKTFRELDEDKNNYITVDEMTRFLKNYFSHDELNDDECLMVMKFFDTDGEGRIDYNEFAAKIIGKDVGVTNYQTSQTDDMGDTVGAGEEVQIDEAEMARYMAIAKQAQARDHTKALVQSALKEFQIKAESMSNDALLSEFRLYDRHFDNTITLADFKTILVHTLSLDEHKADATIEEVVARLNVQGDVLTFSQYRSAFKLS
jgi:Ca2+-binding EF-hand superfamily protein